MNLTEFCNKLLPLNISRYHFLVLLSLLSNLLKYVCCNVLPAVYKEPLVDSESYLQ